MNGGAVLAEPPLSIERVEVGETQTRFARVVYRDGWEVRPGQHTSVR